MQKDYFDRVHRWGILWNFGAILILLCVPIAICVHFGVWPEGSALVNIMPKLMGLYWVTAIVAVITYVPLLVPAALISALLQVIFQTSSFLAVSRQCSRRRFVLTQKRVK